MANYLRRAVIAAFIVPAMAIATTEPKESQPASSPTHTESGFKKATIAEKAIFDLNCDPDSKVRGFPKEHLAELPADILGRKVMRKSNGEKGYTIWLQAQ